MFYSPPFLKRYRLLFWTIYTTAWVIGLYASLLFVFLYFEIMEMPYKGKLIILYILHNPVEQFLKAINQDFYLDIKPIVMAMNIVFVTTLISVPNYYILKVFGNKSRFRIIAYTAFMVLALLIFMKYNFGGWDPVYYPEYR